MQHEKKEAVFVLVYFIQYTNKCQHAKTVNKREMRPCCTSFITLRKSIHDSDMLTDQYFHALKKIYTINIHFQVQLKTELLFF